MILGLESSCDESALSLLEEDGTIIGEWVHSQVAQHAEYGGGAGLGGRRLSKKFLSLTKIGRPEWGVVKVRVSDFGSLRSRACRLPGEWGFP